MQKEETASEQLDKYLAIESVDNFVSSSTDYLKAVVETLEPENPSPLQDAARAVANLSVVCDALINESEVPDKCQEIHEEYKTAAEKLKEAGDHYLSASTELQYKDYIGYKRDLEKATSCINDATSASLRAKDLINEIRASDTGAAGAVLELVVAVLV